MFVGLLTSAMLTWDFRWERHCQHFLISFQADATLWTHESNRLVIHMLHIIYLLLLLILLLLLLLVLEVEVLILKGRRSNRCTVWYTRNKTKECCNFLGRWQVFLTYSTKSCNSITSAFQIILSSHRTKKSQKERIYSNATSDTLL